MVFNPDVKEKIALTEYIVCEGGLDYFLIMILLARANPSKDGGIRYIVKYKKDFFILVI